MDHFRNDGLRLAYIDAAPTGADRGEPVVLVHGFASNHAVNWVNTLWVKTLTAAGRRVLAFDNRGHGQSDKPHDVASYATPRMADDVRALLDHVRIERADIIGYSMGARIAAFCALQFPERTRAIVLGGLGIHLVEGVGLPLGIADAMEAPALDSLSDPMQRLFRAFADANGNDLQAMAACIRGSRQTLTRADIGRIACPALMAVGTRDAVAGDPHQLAALNPRARALDIPSRDHNLAVGDRVFKEGVSDFLDARP